MKRRDGSEVHTQMGKNTEISRLFMVRGGTLKMMPSSSGPQVSLKSPVLMRVRYSQMSERCQFHWSGVTGSRICQACSTKVFRLSCRERGPLTASLGRGGRPSAREEFAPDLLLFFELIVRFPSLILPVLSLKARQHSTRS